MKKDQEIVAIIGSGIAGLSAAVRLAIQGKKVVVFEKNSYTGGKVTAFVRDGFRFDMGPSLFTMPHLMDEIFESAGRNPKDYFEYHKNPEACRYFWMDGQKLTLFPTIEENVKEVSRVFGPEAGDSIQKYFNDARKKFELTAPFFLEKSLHRVKTFLSPKVLKVVAEIPKLGLFSTLDHQNKRYFKEPKLVQVFNRFATYNGSSPYHTPGIMQMIAHLEHGIGTYFPKGGMHSISQSLTRLARDLGVRFELNSNVDEICIENKKVSGLIVDGSFVACDKIVCNADVKHVYQSVIPEPVKRPKKTLAQEPSSSALIFYWGIAQSFKELDLHNIIFSLDYEREFDRIRSNGAFWEDPTIYIHVSNRLEKNDAPPGKDSWFVMVNVPHDQGQNWSEITDRVRNTVIERISEVLEVDIESLIETEDILTPPEIQSRTSSMGGALYGTSSNDRMAAFLRHSNKSKDVKGLYFCGGSVHPGGGIPLCLLSGKIAAEWIGEDE